METVPEQPTAKAPIKKTMPIVLVLLGAVLLIGISTAYNAMTGAGRKKDAAAKSTLQTKPPAWAGYANCGLRRLVGLEVDGDRFAIEGVEALFFALRCLLLGLGTRLRLAGGLLRSIRTIAVDCLCLCGRHGHGWVGLGRRDVVILRLEGGNRLL